MIKFIQEILRLKSRLRKKKRENSSKKFLNRLVRSFSDKRSKKTEQLCFQRKIIFVVQSVHSTIMWFSLVILIIIQPSESVIQLEQHFRPLGKVATGLTYAHLSAQINVSSLEHAFTSLVKTIILREKASNASVEQALLAIIAPQLLIGKRAIKDVQFFMKETSDRDIVKIM